MSLKIETRQVESAEAKAWSNMDPESVLIERANVLEEAEQKLVEKTSQMDPSFATYEPVYTKRFDISDLKEDVEALLGVNSFSIGTEGRKEVAKAAIERARKHGVLNLDDKRFEEIVDNLDEESFENTFNVNNSGVGGDDEEVSESDEEESPSAA